MWRSECGKTARSHVTQELKHDKGTEVLPPLFPVPKEAWSCSELSRGDHCGQLGVGAPQSALPPQTQPCSPFRGWHCLPGPFSTWGWARPSHPFKLPKESPQWLRSWLGSTNFPDFHKPRNGNSLTSPLSFAMSPVLAHQTRGLSTRGWMWTMKKDPNSTDIPVPASPGSWLQLGCGRGAVPAAQEVSGGAGSLSTGIFFCLAHGLCCEFPKGFDGSGLEGGRQRLLQGGGISFAEQENFSAVILLLERETALLGNPCCRRCSEGLVLSCSRPRVQLEQPQPWLTFRAD